MRGFIARKRTCSLSRWSWLKCVAGDFLYLCPSKPYLTSRQVFTGTIPFSNGSSVMAMLAIAQGKRPPRPTHSIFTEKLWTLMQRCWDQDPHSRPEASEILAILLTPWVPVRSGDGVFIDLTSRLQRTPRLEAVDQQPRRCQRTYLLDHDDLLGPQSG